MVLLSDEFDSKEDEEFLSNSNDLVILMNHDADKIIGKFLESKGTSKNFLVKAFLSESIQMEIGYL